MGVNQMEIDGKEKMQKAEAVKVDEFQHLGSTMQTYSAEER